MNDEAFESARHDTRGALKPEPTGVPVAAAPSEESPLSGLVAAMNPEKPRYWAERFPIRQRLYAIGAFAVGVSVVAVAVPGLSSRLSDGLWGTVAGLLIGGVLLFLTRGRSV